MSLQDVRVKLETGLNDIYTALEEKSATIPEQKNLINVAPAIRSITGGGGEEPEQPQVHNYLMLYDGTLGEAGENGANVCADVTGGYKIGREGTTYWEELGPIYNPDNLYLNSDNSAGGIAGLHYWSSFISNNLINLKSYLYAVSLAYGHVTSNSVCQVKTAMYQVQDTSNSNRLEIFSSKSTNYINNSKQLCSVNISDLIEAYFGGVASEEGQNVSQLKIYSSFLVKQDDYQPILDLAGITTTYTDEASICASQTAMTTILNNKESIDYMVHNCTGTFMLAFLQSETALNALNASPYKVLVYQNDVWIKFLSMVA